MLALVAGPVIARTDSTGLHVCLPSPNTQQSNSLSTHFMKLPATSSSSGQQQLNSGMPSLWPEGSGPGPISLVQNGRSHAIDGQAIETQHTVVTKVA